MGHDDHRGLRLLGLVVVLVVATLLVGRFVDPAAALPTNVLVLYVYLRLTRSPKRRAMEERLGGRDEVRRFTRAWASGEVPPDADRSLWLAELPHLPDGTTHRRLRRSSAVAFVVLVVATFALFAGAATTSGDVGGQLGYVAYLVVPLAILSGVFAAMLRLITPADERTERLRRALGAT